MELLKDISRIELERYQYADYRRIHRSDLSDVSQVSVHPGMEVPGHAHENEEQTYVFLGGEGVVRINDEDFKVREGMAIHIPIGATHSCRNTGSQPLVYIYFGAFRK